MKKFAKIMIYIITSIINKQQKQYPSQTMVAIVFLISTIQKITLLFPEDGYMSDLYQDQYLKYLRDILSPFLLSFLLKYQGNELMTLIILAIIGITILTVWIVLLLLDLMYQKKLYHPLYPKGVFRLIQYLIYQWFLYFCDLIYLPLASIIIGILVCNNDSILASRREGNCAGDLNLFISLIGYPVMVMFFLTNIVITYIFRTSMLKPDNSLMKKFSYINIINMVNFSAILLANIYKDETSGTYLRIFLHNLTGLIWIFEVKITFPYPPPLNQLIFRFAVLYETFSIILTISLGSNFLLISKNQVFFYLVIFGTLTWYLAGGVYDRQITNLLSRDSKSLNNAMYKSQIIYYFYLVQNHNEEYRFYWYYATVCHLNQCKSEQCQQKQLKMQQESIQSLKQLTLLLVRCILEKTIKFVKGNRKNYYEQGQLMYITFLNRDLKQPLPAYCELKSYQQMQFQHTFYFQCMCESLNDQIRQEIIEKQESMKTRSSDLNEREQTTYEIYKSNCLTEDLIPIFLRILNRKIFYWQSLLNGYNDITEFAENTIALSNDVLNFRNKLKEQDYLVTDIKGLMKQKKINTVITLRLFSIYNSFILNDYENSLVAEQKIEEILRNERSLPSEMILNQTLLDEKVLMLTISTMKNRGGLVSINQTLLSKFLQSTEQYDLQNFDNISQMMPQFIQEHHDSILERYLLLGYSEKFYSSTLVFIQQMKGFISPCSMKINNFFQARDDYLLTASFVRVKESEDFILFDREGKILGLSQRVFQFLKGNGGNYDLSIQDLFLQGYIFLIIPGILNILAKNRSDLCNSEIDIMEERTIITVRNNLKAYLHKHSNYQLEQHHLKSLKKRVNNNIRIDSEIRRQQSEHSSKGDYEYIREDFCDQQFMLGCQIPLLAEIYQNVCLEFINNQEVYQSNIIIKQECNIEKDIVSQFVVKYFLRYKILGHGLNSFPYFYLEITDFKNRDLKTYKQATSTNQTVLGNVQEVSFYQTSDIDKSDISKVSPLDFSQEIPNIPFETLSKQSKNKELYFNQQKESLKVKESGSLNQQLSDISEIKEEDYIQVVEQNRYQSQLQSPQNELSQVPLSKKAAFVRPKGNQIQYPQEDNDIELDFKNLMESPSVNDLAFQSYSKIQSKSSIQIQEQQFSLRQNRFIGQLDLIQEFQDDADQNDRNDQQKESSKKETPQSQKINKLLRQNNGEGQKEFVQASQSSRSYMSGKRETLAIIDGIRQSASFHTSLRKNSIIYSLVIFSLLLFLIMNVVINQNNNLIQNEIVDDVMTPYLLTSAYFKTFVLGWIYVGEQLNIVEASNFLRNKIQNETKILRQTLLEEIVTYYPILLRAEQEGLIGHIDIKYVQEDALFQQQFTLFYFIIEDKLKSMLQIDFTKSLKEQDSQFLIDLLFLKLNLKDFINLSKDLIDSLQQIFFKDLNEDQNSNLSWMIAQITITFTLISCSLIFWQESLVYQKRILLITARVSEKAGQQMMLKYLLFFLTKMKIYPSKRDANVRYQMEDGEFFLHHVLTIRTRGIRKLLTGSKIDQKYFIKRQCLKQHSILLLLVLQTQKGKGRNLMLYSKIRQIEFSILKDLLIASFMFILCFCQFLGGYLYETQLDNNLSGTQKVALNFISYAQDMNILQLCGIIIKTEYAIIPEVLDHETFNFRNEIIRKNVNLKVKDQLLEDYIEYALKRGDQIFFMLQTIQLDPEIDASSKQQLEYLLASSLCNGLKKSIPFCQLDKLGGELFESIYGKPGINDNKLVFMSKGLLGLHSQSIQVIKEYFGFEINNHQYITDALLLKQYLNSKEFVQPFLQHFLDYHKGYLLFIDTIVNINRNIIMNNGEKIQLYIIFTGLVIIIILSYTFIFWVRGRNDRILKLKLGITNIPFENLFEDQMVMLLKKLNQE